MRHAPMTRGVSQLMYVGDDAAPNPAMPSNRELGVGVVAGVVALSSTGLVRLASAGIAAWIGYKAYKARRVTTL